MGVVRYDVMADHELYMASRCAWCAGLVLLQYLFTGGLAHKVKVLDVLQAASGESGGDRREGVNELAIAEEGAENGVVQLGGRATWVVEEARGRGRC